ncbi:MAG TPA: 2-amino-4-hydroxy-6-hydroxymethyldihydropteridine diphosphokinase [Granulicella sp.]|nr:2-amino-4-hydroxy-6-hydroxymethyldihydropteridine diphosphokinase [Granulicella sp.]
MSNGAQRRVAAIALGSNLGSGLGSGRGPESECRGREANLREAVARLGGLGRVTAVSSYYDTAPVGYLEQPRFLNGALLLETELEPEVLLEGLLEVERTMGRDRSAAVAKGPRVIDLDLLLFGGVVMETPALTLPHPALRERRFVLEPLREIAPEMVDPVTGRTVAQLYAELGPRE